jgi:hypothetical protein
MPVVEDTADRPAADKKEAQANAAKIREFLALTK